MVASSSSLREEEEEVQDRPAGCFYPESARQAGDTQKCLQGSSTVKFLCQVGCRSEGAKCSYMFNVRSDVKSTGTWRDHLPLGDIEKNGSVSVLFWGYHCVGFLAHRYSASYG